MDRGEVGDVALVDLRPAADPRADDVAVRVERDFLLVPARKRDCLGARADPAHLAEYDIEHLRQFIEPGPTQQPPEPRDPLIVVERDIAVAVRIMVANRHRAELPHMERLAAIPHSLLAKESGPARIDPDREGDYDHRHDQDGEYGEREYQVDRALDLAVSEVGQQRTETVLG